MSEQTLQRSQIHKALPDQIIEFCWKMLTSIKLALVLILLIAGASIIGAALVQAPPPALESDAQFDLWLGSVEDKYGSFTGLFASLGFFSIFTQAWFRLMVALLAANVTVCTIHRTPKLWQRARRVPPVRQREVLFEKAPLRSEGRPAATAEEAVSVMSSVFHRQRYRVRTEQEGSVTHVVGEKNRYGRLATLLTHAGIVAVLIGAVWGGRGGFRESQFVVAEGAERAVGHDTGITVVLESFVDEYYAGGGGIPKDYRSNVVLMKDGEAVTSGTVRVNEPIRYDGISVHQSYYGPAVEMIVQDEEGRVLQDGPVPLHYRTADRPAGSFALASMGIEVFVIGPASAFVDPVIRPGEVRLEVYEIGGSEPLALQNVPQGVTQRIGNLDFVFIRESRFSGLQIVKDPALPLVWLGSAMLVLGSAAVLYFPHRRVWGRIEEERDGLRVRLAAPRERGLPFDAEFRKLSLGSGARPHHDSDDEPERS